MTLASLALSWRVLNGIPVTVFEVWGFGPGLASIIPFVVLFGALLSILSRFGGVASIVGALAYAVDLPAEFGLGSNTAPVYSSFGVGYWIVWIGAIISLTGRSWNLPFLQKLYSGLRHQGEFDLDRDPAGRPGALTGQTAAFTGFSSLLLSTASDIPDDRKSWDHRNSAFRSSPPLNPTDA